MVNKGSGEKKNQKGGGTGAEEVGAGGCFIKGCWGRALTFAPRPGRGGLH